MLACCSMKVQCVLGPRWENSGGGINRRLLHTLTLTSSNNPVFFVVHLHSQVDQLLKDPNAGVKGALKPKAKSGSDKLVGPQHLLRTVHQVSLSSYRLYLRQAEVQLAAALSLFALSTQHLSPGRVLSTGRWPA